MKIAIWEVLWDLLEASYAPFGSSWCLLGASWRPLEELLGAFYGSLTFSSANLLRYIKFSQVLFFLKRERENQAPAGLLAASFQLLGASWELLGGS